MPLFVRSGSLVPMGPAVQWSGENPQGPITLHVFAGADGTFTLYEDQGTDMGYERGEFARTRFRWNDTTRTLTIGARQGSYPGMRETRKIGIVVHDGATGTAVLDRQPVRWLDYSGEELKLEL